MKRERREYWPEPVGTLVKWFVAREAMRYKMKKIAGGLTRRKDMGVIKREDVVASWVDGQLVCADCLQDKDEETSFLTEEDIDSSDDIYVCDRCQKRID